MTKWNVEAKAISVRPDGEIQLKIEAWRTAMEKRAAPGQRVTESDVIRAMLRAAPDKPRKQA
jgi:hypothetical protein